MKIKWEGYLGKNHSWSVVGQNICRALIAQKHTVHLVSTNGYEHLPPDLQPYIVTKPHQTYDIQLSYTAMHNFKQYFSRGDRNRFAIWNYEFDIIPFGMAKYVNYVDCFMPSSKFFYDICLKNKIPPEKMTIVPHGVDWNRFENAVPMKIPTDKRHKFLMNFGQPHIRKNIDGALEAFGRAFTKNDDVCLVIKAVDKPPTSSFEVNFGTLYRKFCQKYPNHAECVILDQYIPKIEQLYRACDALFMIPNAEAFFFPALEMLAAGGTVITSNYGGQLDFLTHDNALLIGGQMVRAPIMAQYWSGSPYASMFAPDINQAVEALRVCCRDMDMLKQKSQMSVESLKPKFSWDVIATQITNRAK